MAQTRWKCPTCGHGLLAPERPRRNDIRRYCLPCSKTAGVLVERIAPRLEAARAAAKQKQAAKEKEVRKKAAAKRAPIKAAETRARQRQAIFEKEAERIWALLGEWSGRQLGKPPTITIVKAHRGWVSGQANRWNARIRIGGRSTGGADVWETLAHELVHGVVNVKHAEGAHGRTFYQALRYVTEKRWKVTVRGFHVINGTTDSSHSWGYKVDWIIRRSLEEDKVVKFEFPPFEV